jgi:hypothetical protein
MCPKMCFLPGVTRERPPAAGQKQREKRSGKVMIRPWFRVKTYMEVQLHSFEMSILF